MRPTLVPGRWPGALLAAVGVLLAVPTVIWPVVIIGYATPDEGGYSGSPFGQGIWSWGKYSQLGAETNGSVFEMSNTVGLVCLILLLVVGVGSTLAWAVVDGPPGEALGLAGTCLAAAAQLTSLSQWAGQQLSGFYDGDNGIGIDVRAAGWLQIASAVILVVAVAFMVWRPVWSLLGPAWQTYGAGRRTEATPVPADGPKASQLGTAAMREPGGRGRAQLHDDRPSVGFSDDERATGGRSRELD